MGHPRSTVNRRIPPQWRSFHAEWDCTPLQEAQTTALHAGIREGLSTETRIKCFGSAALWKFRPYWSLVRPFSGLIRKAILKQVKTAAESKAKV